MSHFTILLGGELQVTPRLRKQIARTRFIAADSGMMHASVLEVRPELWVGDFDSAGSELAIQYRDIPRQTFPAEKDATDGAIAVAEALRRGATEIVLLGGLGGQTDHTTGLLSQSLQLQQSGTSCMLTSGVEEAYPVIEGSRTIDLPEGSRISIVPFAGLQGLDLDGVKWPLVKRDVPLGSTLTLSNVATGPVVIAIRQGYAMTFAYPQVLAND